MKQNNSTKLSGQPFLKIYKKRWPSRLPQTSNPQLYRIFPKTGLWINVGFLVFSKFLCVCFDFLSFSRIFFVSYWLKLVN